MPPTPTKRRSARKVRSRVRRSLFPMATDRIAASLENPSNDAYRLTGKKRRRLLLTDTADDDAGIDTTRAAQDKLFAESVVKKGVEIAYANGCVWPNGCECVQQQLLEHCPGYYWVIIRYTENNLSVSQPANKAYVFIWRDFLVMGFPA